MTISRFDRPKRPGAICALALVLLAPAAVAQQLPVPSGLDVSLFDLILEDDTGLARFRFLAPEITVDDSGRNFASVAEDIQYLCDALVVPSLAANDWAGSQVIVSLSSTEVAFGATAPDVTQFFQPFTIADAACQWEDF